jgi:xanthine dehydrogenase accessory factor
MLDDIIVVRSGGDIGTAVAHKLFRSGFRVVITEILEPLAIRRMVAFSEAVFDGEITVEGVSCRKISSIEDAATCFKENVIPLIIDETGSIIEELKPSIVIDAILAKRNIGTRMSMAPMTIGLGPGFTAGVDVHAIIETNRGHDLGRIIYEGSAERNTGIPGIIMGYGGERVLRASATGKVKVIKGIGELVEKDEVVMMVGEAEVRTQIAGVIRGCIRDGVHVPQDMKIGDVDPRGVLSNCATISDKARCIAGGVLEAVLNHLNFNK